MAPSEATPDDGWEDYWTTRTVRNYPDWAASAIHKAATLMRSLKSERDALAAVIEAAPHSQGCFIRLGRTTNPCTCFKSRVPSTVLAARDAELLRDAADSNTMPATAAKVRPWLRARAARIEGGTQ